MAVDKDVTLLILVIALTSFAQDVCQILAAYMALARRDQQVGGVLNYSPT
jgi:hypothetical protein